MKKLIALFSALVLIAFAANTVNAQNTDTESANASANILEIIEITKDADLHFGDIVPSGTAGDVTVAPSSAGTRTANNVTLLTQFTTQAAAAFTVNGEKNAAYYITLPSGDITLTESVSSATMVINTFTTDKASNESQLNGSGTDSFFVGAKLSVGGTQTAGLYEGSFDVTVTYE